MTPAADVSVGEEGPAVRPAKSASDRQCGKAVGSVRAGGCSEQRTQDARLPE